VNGKIFVDTWGWLAIGHRRDSFHGAVKEHYQKLRKENCEFFTSEYVIDETITFGFKCASILHLQVSFCNIYATGG
jgi:predicted nucleic acid-binding protein